MNDQMTAAHWSILVITAMLFGSSFFFIKLTVAGIPPLTLAAGRAAMSAVAVLVFLRFSNYQLPKLSSAWLPIVVLGILTGAIPFVGIAWGQIHIESSLGGILFAIIPVFSALLAPIFLDEERLSINRVIGIALGFAGVTLAIGPNALTGFSAQTLGVCVTIIAALSYATGNIYARTQHQLTPIAMAAGQLTVAAIVLIPLSVLMDQPWTLNPSTSEMVSLAVVALFNTAIPVLLMFWLVHKVGATNTSILAFFTPVAPVFLGVTVLGEDVINFAMVGLALIIMGATMATGNLTWSKLSKS